MDPEGSSSGATPDALIGSATSLEDIMAALAQRSCADLTVLIDLDTCGKVPIAGGGFSDVFRGELKGGTKIAIKTLRVYDRPGDDDEKQKILKRAAREIYCWSKLTHPNVLQLKGLAVFNGYMSMISEWMDNGNLMSYVRLNRNTDRLDLCLGVCEGLCYIHAKGMVHGDLKAANVMVSRSGVPQITDFGNSQLKDATLNFTNTKSFSHTVRWTSPELFNNDGGPHASKEADVYAYGMTVLEVMTRQTPFEGLSDCQVIGILVNKKEVPRPNAGIGDDLWDVLTRSCWAQEPTERANTVKVRDQIGSLVVKNYTDIIVSNPNEPVLLVKRAALCMTIKKFAMALADYQTLATLQPTSLVRDTLFQVARCHLALGYTSACITALRDFPDSVPGTADIRRRAEQTELHIQQFKDARDKNEWILARSALDQAVEMLGGNVPLQWGH